MVKMRDNGHVQNQAIYVVLGMDLAGAKGSWVCGWHSRKSADRKP